MLSVVKQQKVTILFPKPTHMETISVGADTTTASWKELLLKSALKIFRTNSTLFAPTFLAKVRIVLNTTTASTDSAIASWRLKKMRTMFLQHSKPVIIF